MAKEFAKVNGFVYVDACVSKCLNEAGFDSSNIQTLPIHEFLMAQNLVLNHIVTIASEVAPDPQRTYVMDRTPLDAVAYYRAYFGGKFFYDAELACPEQFNRVVQDYVNRAHTACRNHYSTIIGVQPGIKILAEDGKALASNAFIEHLNVLLVGELISFSERLKTSTPHCVILNRDIIDLDERVEVASNLWSEGLALNFFESKLNIRSHS